MSIRTVIKKVVSGAIQLVDFSGRSGETFTRRELFQQYGFASRPLSGSEGIGVFIGGDPNNAVIVATEDRRYRVAVVDGEVAVYTDEGDKVHFQRGQKILVQSGNEVDVVATTKIKLKAPLIELHGVIQSYDHDGGAAGTATFHGNLNATGEITDKTRAMSADRAIYNSHTHPPGNNPPAPQE